MGVGELPVVPEVLLFRLGLLVVQLPFLAVEVGLFLGVGLVLESLGLGVQVDVESP